MSMPRLAVMAILASLLSSVLAVHVHGRDLNAPLQSSYDYVVVGCGISGLVVTNRLSETESVTVLCIEAGDPDHYEAVIQDPVYVGADVGGIYDWRLSTVPQTQLDGATRPMPQGKVLGGGSILNAMCWNRGGRDDYDTWAALGNPGWDWEGMLPYFIKSETYTPVYSEEVAREYSINYNPAVHGTSGPVQVSYPKYFYPQSANLFAGLNALGVPTEFDPNDGTSAGAAFIPTDLDPNNQTRSDARRTYFDPYVGRENFHVITGQHVTRVLVEAVPANGAVSNPESGGNLFGNGMESANNEGFGFGPEGSTPQLAGQTPPRLRRRDANPTTASLRVTGVEFATNATAPRQTVIATREVIVAAGSLHSAQLLQLSGIGPAPLLAEYDIPLALDLPGVGNNLQDHCLVGTFYPYNNASYPSPTELTTNLTYNTEAEIEYNTYKTGPWTAGSPNALAFNPLPLITNESASILSSASSQDPSEYLVADLDPTIVAGYASQKQSLIQRLAETNVASYEIINNNAGSLTVSVMHPFSRGTCTIQSADPFEPPLIDPRWLTNPADRDVLIAALRFNREILATPPMLELQAAQFVPPVDADEDALNEVINNGIRTEFHPSGTCAMLPLEQGGVVDSHLRVWGTQNLRVVDAGIFPMIPAAHLQAVVYGVAEKAADIIKGDNVQPSIVSTSASSSTTAAAASSSSMSSTFSSTRSLTSSTSLASSSTSSSPVFTLSYSVSLTASGSGVSLSSTPSSGSTPGTTELGSPISGSVAIAALSPSGAGPSRNSISLATDTSSSARAGVGSQALSSTVPAKVGISSTPITPYGVSSSAAPSPTESRPSEIVVVVTTTLASEIPAFLSSFDVTAVRQSASKQMVSAGQSAPIKSNLSPSDLTTSVVAELTSAGVPAPVASSLLPIVIGSPSTSNSTEVETATAGPKSAIASREQEDAQVNAIIGWLLQFFNLE